MPYVAVENNLTHFVGMSGTARPVGQDGWILQELDTGFKFVWYSGQWYPIDFQNDSAVLATIFLAVGELAPLLRQIRLGIGNLADVDLSQAT